MENPSNVAATMISDYKKGETMKKKKKKTEKRGTWMIMMIR